MKQLSKEQQEKLTLAIQAALGVAVIGMSVINSAKLQTAQARKLAKKDTRRILRRQRQESRLEKQLLRQKYRTRIQNEKLRRAAGKQLYASFQKTAGKKKAYKTGSSHTLL